MSKSAGKVGVSAPLTDPTAALDLLVSEIDLAIREGGQKALQRVLSRLKRGIPKGGDVVGVGGLLDVLRGWESVDRLCLHLAGQSRGKRNVLVQRVSHHLCQDACNSLGYPGDKDSGTDVVGDVRRWMSAHLSAGSITALSPGVALERIELPKRPRPWTKEQAVALARHLRRGLTCLLTDRRLAGDSDLLYEYLDLSRALVSQRAEPRSTGLRRLLVTTFGKASVSLPQLESMLSSAAPARLAVVEAHGEARRCRDELRKLQVEFNGACAARDAQIAENRVLRERLKGASDEIAKLKAAIEDGNNRLRATEEHWEKLNRDAVAGLTFKVSRQILHEVDQINACLNRPDPNVKMALGCVEDLAAIARRLGNDRGGTAG